ncbi:Uma2 family endonuclease [Halotia branconii]|uniref:Uma2 family endonuclease n=1 Tax=Halotia branconii CENA392 TaxID=1539056 RepID=A0AAJ6NQR9_9CYAN|nr:Uma2 family endonuclease [Halotia branconii]WGV24862.1 Uma2 family endonuclease [Halotia branconii CENA392]
MISYTKPEIIGRIFIQNWYEYWIVDPIQEQVTVLEWIEGFYEEKVYVGDNAIASLVFADLKLTAAQVLQG